ncbi:sugar phosphate isomerase/epimerase family protein [Planctomycetota bacterium]
MNLGLSLPVEFLSGIDTSGDTEHLRRVFSDPDTLLDQLTAREVAAIEIKSMYRETTPAANLKAFDCVRRHGLRAMMHAFLPGTEEAGELETVYACYATLFEALRNSATELIMIVHALRDEDRTIPANRDTTAAVLRKVSDYFARQDIPVRIALEINRNHGRPDPSYTYAGVLEILKDLHDAGICFDFGHTFWNVERFELAAIPPAAFLQRVIHTHIHDIGTTGTHYPISLGTVPVQDYVRSLQEAGYEGVFNLELGCYAFAEEFDVKTGFLQSVEILRETVGKE